MGVDGRKDVRYAITPRPRVVVEIEGESALFPVNRIYCVARNYQALARQLGSDERDPPFFFMKPADALVGGIAAVPYPSNTRDFQHEVELVIAIGLGGANIPVGRALDHIFGFAVGNDLTRRDRQAELVRKGQPWDLAKAFDRSAQVGKLKRLDPHMLADAPIWLTVDGEQRQYARTSEMTWGIAEIISILSQSFDLQAGDLIYTGTPAGVGKIEPGQLVVGGIEGLSEIHLKVFE